MSTARTDTLSAVLGGTLPQTREERAFLGAVGHAPGRGPLMTNCGSTPISDRPKERHEGGAPGAALVPCLRRVQRCKELIRAIAWHARVIPAHLLR
jgi:hypothetical protein